ncbi:MAG TPA: N-acetylmuramic acid 6-phosphate etherase [Spirochaetales bacterium]|nr:N-acetylmuramic acid 6-phosphate etherase [Spirochaetales bacterium]
MNAIIEDDYLEHATTESRNMQSEHIDALPVIDILKIINEEDKKVPFAVEKALPAIAALVEDVVHAFNKDGRLVYIGAGTSGRLGVLDASECPPTFGVPPTMVVGLIAGGDTALRKSIEGAEDRPEDGAAALKAIDFTDKDVLVGITASGAAPYVLGAMEYARSLGAVVGALSCNRGSKTFELAKHKILVEVGPEVITGSTRMKAGTAQKLVLNMLTTASMVRLGKVYGNLMVDLMPVNRKLVERSKRLIRQATGCSKNEAEAAFIASGRRPKVAIVMVLLKVSAPEAEELLAQAEGRISEAVQLYTERRTTCGSDPQVPDAKKGQYGE